MGAEPIKMRIREGCRGGQEQFRWGQVKDQEFKDREQYLGQSTKVGMMGKFGRYYVHDWYAKKRDTPESVQSELQSVQAYEEELMQEALGLKPKKLLLTKKQLSEEELKEFLSHKRPEGKQGRAQMGPQKKVVTNEFGEQVAEDDITGKAYLEAPIKGLGFASHRTAKLEEYKAKTLGTEAKLEGCKEQGPIKIEDGDDIIKLGFGQTKSEPSVKQEPGVKVEPAIKKEEPRQDAKEEDMGSAVAGLQKEEPVEANREAKDERGLKRKGDPEDTDDERRRKAAKKEHKAEKKARKEQKKAEKKAKKAAKKAKKAARKLEKEKAKRKASSGSSSSSSS